MHQILVSLSNTIEQKVIEALLLSEEFSAWSNHLDKFTVSASHPAASDGSYDAIVDVKLVAIPNVRLPSPHAISTSIPSQCNTMQSKVKITGGHVMSGSPSGGTIRFSYKAL